MTEKKKNKKDLLPQPTPPLEVLRLAILAGDWDGVRRGWFLLTGTAVEPASPPEESENEKKEEEPAPGKKTRVRKRISERKEETQTRETPGNTDSDRETGPTPRSLPDFTHRHGESRRDAENIGDDRDADRDADRDDGAGHRTCRVVPFRPGEFRNDFRDDRKTAVSDHRVDRVLTKGLSPSPRTRPKAGSVELRCSRCSSLREVDRDLVELAGWSTGSRPRRTGRDEDDSPRPSFVCDDCLTRGGGDHDRRGRDVV